ncbi:hypothetical protein [Clostridium sp. DL1XJH146]
MTRYKNRNDVNSQEQENYFEGSKQYFDYLIELKSSQKSEDNDDDYDSMFMIL